MSNGGTRVTVEGADTLAATLRAAARDLDNVSGPLDDAARLVQTRARTGAPVDTGALARSITTAPARYEVTVGTGIGVYAGVQEYGSATTPAHPYLRPAFDQSNTIVTRMFAEHASDAISKVRGA